MAHHEKKEHEGHKKHADGKHKHMGGSSKALHHKEPGFGAHVGKKGHADIEGPHHDGMHHK